MDRRPAASPHASPTIEVLDAAGLGLFSVTAASIARHLPAGHPSEAIVLGAISGIGGGILRDLIVREIPQVLRSGLYAIPAIIGATIVVIAQRAGAHGVIFPLLGATACFAVRVAAIRYDLSLPPRTE